MDDNVGAHPASSSSLVSGLSVDGNPSVHTWVCHSVLFGV